MPKTKTSRYDVAEHLRTPEEMAAYLEACLEEANGDASFIAKALGEIARAKGMAHVARETGLSRESLYKALSGDRSPSFDTILKVVAALGMTLHVSKKPGRGRADLALLRRVSDAEIARSSPPELADLPDDFWKSARRRRPAKSRPNSA